MWEYGSMGVWEYGSVGVWECGSVGELCMMQVRLKGKMWGFLQEEQL